MKSTLARYFTHVEGFGDDTVFFRYRGPGRGKRIDRKGGEHQSSMSLRQALTAVKCGNWIEITEQQAKNLLEAWSPSGELAGMLAANANVNELLAKDIARRCSTIAHHGKTPEERDFEAVNGTGKPSPSGILK